MERSEHKSLSEFTLDITDGTSKMSRVQFADAIKSKRLWATVYVVRSVATTP